MYNFGDVVTLVQRAPDGTISSVNAYVLASVIQPPSGKNQRALKDGKGKLLPDGEYLDLVFPNPAFANGASSVRDLGQLFRHAYAVGKWHDAKNIGWKPTASEDLTAELQAKLTIANETIAQLQQRIDAGDNAELQAKWTIANETGEGEVDDSER